ncbi:MAG: hypothetical protein ACLPYZ_02425 [Limisphaerales bacterium]
MRMAAIRPAATVVMAVFLFGLVFAIYTQHVWEDYWITFRCSRNLATGHGLVFTPGERVHSFTSPLGVLLPAGFSWLTGNESDELALWLFRLTSLAALAAGMGLLFLLLQRLQQHRLAIWLTVALLGLDAKLVDFSINGMETGLLFFFLALTIHGLVVPGSRQILRIGVGWAGLMWTRPDSFVYIAALGISALLFSPNRTAGQSRKELWKTLLAACLVCTVLYLPWFLWAWSYYGSPVPHTIVAKGTNLPPFSLSAQLFDLLVFPGTLLIDVTSLLWVFTPTYAWFGGWPGSIFLLCTVLGIVAALAWPFPPLRPQTRQFSMVFFLGNFFLTAVLKEYYPWYLPTVAVFGYLTIGLIFDQALCSALRLPQCGWVGGWLCHLPKALRISAVGLVIGQAAVTICVARQMRVQQQLIENGLRCQIGLWLRAHARTPHDTVMLEPLGYIGYFSGLKMLDYTGLASKEVVEVRKRLGPYRENQIFLELKPDWLVLRPSEIETESFVQRGPLQENYDQVQVFDASEKIHDLGWLLGRPYFERDQTFLVFHRKASASLKPPD